jgi:pyridoxamine 5'-phosphate oxidase
VSAPFAEPAGHPGDPLLIFAAALASARDRETFDPTAMSLATVDERGVPSVRMVLLKGVDARGFTFFTNFESRKAKELDAQGVAALCLHWPKGEQQVRAEGSVARVSDDESDAYFASRDRMSQIGAWASEQSRPLAARADLERRVEEIRARFDGQAVPRPAGWGGYRLVPRAIEFWYGRPSRLHERHRYERTDVTVDGAEAWTSTMLNP